MYKHLHMSLRHLYRDLNSLGIHPDISGSQSCDNPYGIIHINDWMRRRLIGNRSLITMKLSGDLYVRCDKMMGFRIIHKKLCNPYIRYENGDVWTPLWNVEFDSVKFMDKLFRNHLKIKCMNDIQEML